MKARIVASGVLAAAALAAAFIAVSQRQEIGRLMEARAEAGNAPPPGGLSAGEQAAATDAGARAEAPAPAPAPLSAGEKLELMELRNRVATLREQAQALSRTTGQMANLRLELARLEKLASGELPPGYVRRQDAQFMGNASPEATVQSFFWALQQRDTNALASLISSAAWRRLGQELSNHGLEEFFSEAGAIPGFRILSKQTAESADSTTVSLRIEILPGSAEGMPMELEQVDGVWLLNL